MFYKTLMASLINESVTKNPSNHIKILIIKDLDKFLLYQQDQLSDRWRTFKHLY